MRYERYVMPLTAVAALSAAGVAGYLLWKRRQEGREDEPGTLLYGFPLDIEEEVTLYSADDAGEGGLSPEDLMVDEEAFPGFRQD